MSTSLSATNFVLFGADGRISKRASAKDILHSWFELRSNLYERRKAYLLARLEKEHETLRNKVRFIKAVIEGEITISRVKKKVIAATLWSQKYATMSQLNEIQAEERRATVIRNEEEAGSEVAGGDEDALAPGEVRPSEYDYLLTMPLWSLSEEKVEELIGQMNKKRQELETLRKTHIYELWNNDLDEFLAALEKYEEQEEKDRKAHKRQKGEANDRPRKR